VSFAPIWWFSKIRSHIQIVILVTLKCNHFIYDILGHVATFGMFCWYPMLQHLFILSYRSICVKITRNNKRLNTSYSDISFFSLHVHCVSLWVIMHYLYISHGSETLLHQFVLGLIDMSKFPWIGFFIRLTKNFLCT